MHGDLLHQNVLISPDGTKVSAVFSWKCSVLSDFLYDVAWCSFWSAWHQGIGATHLAWNAWTGDDTELHAVADALTDLLAAG